MVLIMLKNAPLGPALKAKVVTPLTKSLILLLLTKASVVSGQDLEAELQQLLDSQIAQTDMIGANLLVDVRGLGTWTIAGGLADIESNTPMPLDSRFRIGSITKVFVSTLILKLVEQGSLTLDTPVGNILPGLLPDGAGASVRHLLSHTSGIKDHLGDTDLIFDTLTVNTTSAWTPEELVQIAVDLGPAGSPGQAYRYSNTGFVTLGLVIEAVTGKPLGTALREQLFEPLRLSDTTASWGTEAADPIVRGYTLLNNQLLDVTEIAHSHEYGNGGLISTVNDLRRFIQLLLSGQVINQSLLTEMLNTIDIGGGYGYGLGIAEFRDDPIRFGHDGREIGYGSQLWYFPEKEMTVAVLANITQADTENLFDQALSTINQLEQAGSVVFPANNQPEIGNSITTTNAPTTALFSGGAISGTDSTYKSTFTETEPFSVNISIDIESRHVGSQGSIYIVVLLGNGSVYARNEAGVFYLLDQDFSNFTSAEQITALGPTEDVVVFQELVVGENSGITGIAIDVVVGYSSVSNPAEIYYHSNPVSFSIVEGP